MDPVTIGLIGIVVLVVVFLLGMPVGFTMAFIGTIGFCVIKGLDSGLGLLARDFWDTFSTYSLTVIPMFVFMGSVAFYSGMSGRLYDAAYLGFGKMRGGLALATVVATAGFSAICGSTNATAAAMGKVSIPEMRRYGYDPSLAAGCAAAAGSLGIMIPPSTIFIIYGILAQESIGKLFIAGVVPGVILACLFLLAVVIWARVRPDAAPGGAQVSLKSKLIGMTGLLEMAALFALVLGGLFSGLFSPTQAGAAGTAGAIIIGLVRRSLSLERFWAATKETLQISAMIFMIVAGATVFGHFMAVTGIPSAIADFFGGLAVPPTAVMILILFMYLIAGMFMDSLAMVMLTVPILFPTVLRLGFDPIWFGVMIVLVVEMGVITPPVGINVYIIKGVAPDISLGQIFKGATVFLVGMVVLAALLLLFPILATWLPSFISY
ncbi:MAG: TRAP transporter large permease [Thermoleophilia bacterium]|nr:TRAP transporter large permease [Thermoleophilia bacterium]